MSSEKSNTVHTVVLVIQYGTYDILQACLNEFVPSKDHRVDVCVVDNNPPEVRDTEFYTNQFPSIHVIFPEENLGFSGGCNIGLQTCRAKDYQYFLILNNDIRIQAEDLVKLEQVLHNHEDIGVIGPLIRNESNGELYSGSEIDWSRAKTRHTKIKGEIPEEELIDVDFVEGCVMMLTRQLLDTLQDFDDQLFLYWEDTDYCVRARYAGYRTAVTTRIEIGHSPSTTIGSGSPLSRYYITRNRLYFFSKHTKGAHSRSLLLARISLSKLIVGLRMMVRRQSDYGKAYLFGVWDFYCGNLGKTNRYKH